jgi:hypothetical protein
MRCPGSIKLNEGLVEVSGPYADLGTMAHSVAAYCLKCNLQAADILDDYAPAVQEYLDFVRSETGVEDAWEAEVDLTNALLTLDSDFGGTADYVRWRPSSRELLVVDFKFGTGVAVDVEDNEQLRLYALGALLSMDVNPRSVRSVICQPRFDDPERRRPEQTFQVFELLDFIATAKEAAVLSRSDNPPIVPGEKQCKWCPAGRQGVCKVAVKFKPHKRVGPRVTVDDFQPVVSN